MPREVTGIPVSIYLSLELAERTEKLNRSAICRAALEAAVAKEEQKAKAGGGTSG